MINYLIEVVRFERNPTIGMVELFILPKDFANRQKIMEAAAQHCYDRTQFQVRCDAGGKFRQSSRLF